jgi:hypothetical protein
MHVHEFYHYRTASRHALSAPMPGERTKFTTEQRQAIKAYNARVSPSKQLGFRFAWDAVAEVYNPLVFQPLGIEVDIPEAKKARSKLDRAKMSRRASRSVAPLTLSLDVTPLKDELLEQFTEALNATEKRIIDRVVGRPVQLYPLTGISPANKCVRFAEGDD